MTCRVDSRDGDYDVFKEFIAQRIDDTARIGLPPENRKHRNGTKHHGVRVHRTARIGAYCTVDGGYESETVIGPNAWLMKGNHVGHDCQIGENTELAPHCSVGGHVVIGRNVKVGQGAIFKPRVRVGDGAVIGCGAVVVDDVSPHTVVVGNPATFLKMAYELHMVPGPEVSDMQMWDEWFNESRGLT